MLVLLCIWGGHPHSAADAQTISEFIHSKTATEWFDEENWTAGIPNAAGDVATFPGSLTAPIAIRVGEPLALGQLVFLNNGPVTLTGADGLMFENPGAGTASLRSLQPASGSFTSVLAVPLTIADGGQLAVEAQLRASVQLSGGLRSTDGSLTKTGVGGLTLAGNNADWNGAFTIDGGTVTAQSATSFGSASRGTAIVNGRLLLMHDNAEPFALSGGVIQAPSAGVRLDGALTLAMDNTALLEGTFRLYGGTTGEGDLLLRGSGNGLFRVEENGLNHGGGVVIENAPGSLQSYRIYVNSAYRGQTTITGAQVVLDTPLGLGTAEAGTTVTNGRLRVHGSASEDIVLTNSVLELWSNETVVSELRNTGDLELDSSTLTTYGSFRGASVYRIAQPLTIAGGGNLISTERGSIVGRILGRVEWENSRKGRHATRHFISAVWFGDDY
ncbi:MAG: hypothetical protein R3E01_21825 [Pirellulaceae bacterium]